MTDFPDFRSRAFLIDHIERTVAFFHPGGLDPAGGAYNVFAPDGTIADPVSRSLVHACRFLFVEATAYGLLGRPEFRDGARHMLDFLTARHRVPETRGYRWELDFADGVVVRTDDRNITYGLSFVIVAHAMALKAGLAQAAPWLDEIVATMERRLYEPEAGLYADQASADWRDVLPYRGQNANMHACEAMILAFEATGARWYIERAEAIAQAITVRQAGLSPLGQVWEHYRTDWSLDPDYNRDDASDGYRPWGYLAGHQTEWAKLLLMLDRHHPAEWHLPRARALFDQAMAIAWDRERGGIFYSYGHDRALYDTTKQQWVHAETLAAAAHLAAATGEPAYWDWYDRIWRFVWQHMADHRHGGWYRGLAADNSLVSAIRGAPDPDYHNIGACAEILTVLGD